MADSTDSGDAGATADFTVDPSTVEENVKAAEEERKDAQATEDPYDDIQAASIDVGREISVPPTVVEDEAPEPELVHVSLNPNFKEPVLEEFTDDNGITRGRVKGYEAPTDLKVFVATAEVDSDYADEVGYVTLPADVPPAVAASLEGHPAVVVE